MKVLPEAPRHPRNVARLAAMLSVIGFLLVLRAHLHMRPSAPTYVLPASYSAVFGGKRGMDAIPFLTSLSIYHPNAHVYISTDTNTYEWYLDRAKALSRRLNLHWTLALDKYDMSMGRDAMTAAGIYKDFLMEKATIMELALTHHNNTILLDADFILLGPLYIPADPRHQLGVSPHFMAPTEAVKFGVYNAGMLWSNQRSIGEAWRENTRISHYFEQAAIEDLIKKYPYFEFGPEHNVGYWRPVHGAKESSSPATKAAARAAFYDGLKLDSATQKITLQGRPVASVHSHFLGRYPWKVANDFVDKILSLMSQSADCGFQQISRVIDWAKGGFISSQLPL